jgi:uncharacterized membrane protein (UPF0136 family)
VVEVSRRFQIVLALLLAALGGVIGYSQHGLREIELVDGTVSYGAIPLWLMLAVGGALIGLIFGAEIDRRIDAAPDDEK